jgi:glycosyl transferase family 25
MLTQVINLDSSSDRLAAIARDLNQHLPGWMRLAAIRPSTNYMSDQPLYNRKRAQHLFGRDLVRGEIGCFLSHLEAIKRLTQSSAEHGLILEDDVQFGAEVVDVINSTRAELRCISPQWACVNLGEHQILRRRHIATIGHRQLFRAYQFPLVTSALLWRREAALSFLKWTEDRGIYAPVDNQLRDWISFGHKGYSFDQPPITLRHFQSTIQQPTLIASNAIVAKRRNNKFTRYEVRQKLPLYWRSGCGFFLGR